jgi:aminoglycoside phosphotransferase (APT) family kinase protein
MNQFPVTPFAEGRTAEVFRWDESHILKLYRDWCPLDWVEYEARVARAIHAAGVASPAAGDIVEVDGRRGLIYERLEGPSMLQDLNARPWRLLKHARALAELQAQINRLSIPGLPSYHQRLDYEIRNSAHLDDETKSRLCAYLSQLPKGASLCHADYHPGNVLMTKIGAVVIDWVTASAGSPWTDVARTSLLLTIGPKGAGKQIHPLLRLVIGLYHRAYLQGYQAMILDASGEMERWRPVIAAARLNENIIPEREALIKMVKESLPPVS